MPQKLQSGQGLPRPESPTGGASSHCKCVCVGVHASTPTVILYWALLDLRAGAGDTGPHQEQLRFSLWHVEEVSEPLGGVMISTV